jgi:hypothetical protein
MINVAGMLYLTVIDQNDSDQLVGGRVMSLDPSTGALVQIGNHFVTRASGADTIPYALAWHAGRLWCGVLNRQDSDPAGAVYFFRPGIDTTWTLDRTAAITNSVGVAFLVSYKGQLFAGHRDGSTNGIVEVRSSIGAWTASLTIADQTFFNAIVFQDALYTTSHNVTTNESYIRKFDGTTWTLVHTTTTGVEEKALPMCWESKGVLFFGGGGNDSGEAALVSSPDGAVWTSRTASLSSPDKGLNMVGTLVI